MTITRTINGVDYSFTLTYEEEQQFNREQSIQFAKNIIENYEDEEGFDQSVYDNDELLLTIASDIEISSMSDNGDIEYRSLREHGVFKQED